MQKCRAPLLTQLPADQLQQQIQGPVDRQSPTKANASGLLVEDALQAGGEVTSEPGFRVRNRGLVRQKKEADYCTELEKYLVLAYFCIAAFKKGRALRQPFVPLLGN